MKNFPLLLLAILLLFSACKKEEIPPDITTNPNTSIGNGTGNHIDNTDTDTTDNTIEDYFTTLKGSHIATTVLGSDNHQIVYTHDPIINKTYGQKLTLNGDILWEKEFDKRATDMIETKEQDGYLILTHGSPNFLTHIDPDGNTIWTKTYPDDDTFDWLTHIIHANDDAYILVGSDSYYINLVKIDLEGDTIWTKKTLPLGIDYISTSAAQATQDGGLAIIGHTAVIENSGEVHSEMLILKIDTLGNVLWQHQFPSFYYGGGSSGESILEDSDGNLVGIGSGHSHHLAYPPKTCTQTIKLDAAGNILWTQNYENQTNGTQIKEVPSGGYIITGSRTPLNEWEARDVFLLRIADNGSVLWEKHYGNAANKETGETVHVSPTEDFLVTGNMQSTEQGMTVYKAFYFATDHLGTTY